MLHTIENDYLKVTVSDHGAELTSVYDKAQDFERIWCADPSCSGAVSICRKGEGRCLSLQRKYIRHEDTAWICARCGIYLHRGNH